MLSENNKKMKMIRDLARTHSRREIADKLGIKYETVSAHIRRNKLPCVKSKFKFGEGRPLGAFDKKPRKTYTVKPKKKGGTLEEVYVYRDTRILEEQLKAIESNNQ